MDATLQNLIDRGVKKNLCRTEKYVSVFDLNEEKGYLFYIFKVSEKGYSYKPVDPKYYSEESLKDFAFKYAKDGILYKTEKECHDVIDNLNKRLSTLVYNKNNIVTIEGCGNVIIKFPSGKTAIIEIDSIRETAFIVENGWRY